MALTFRSRRQCEQAFQDQVDESSREPLNPWQREPDVHSTAINDAMPSNIRHLHFSSKYPTTTSVAFDFHPPQLPELPGTGGGEDENENATWLVIIVLATAILVLLASAIRTCSERAGWMNPHSVSSITILSSAQNDGINSGRVGLRALLSSHLGLDFNGQGSRNAQNYPGGAAAGFGQPGESTRHHYTGPHTYPRDEDLDPEETFEEVDDRWALMTEGQRQSYISAQAFLAAHPPFSVPTDISLAQHISIQEKGVSAWEFEESLVALTQLEASQPQERPRASASEQRRRRQAHVQVHDRTEIFFPAMADNEASVQTNLPIPKTQEIYYWEVKMFEKDVNTVVAVGVATKPYPHSRLPGWNRHSIAYNSRDGSKYCNSIFQGYPYAPCFYEGDVIGCGYRPQTGTIFFTRNGKRLEDAYIGFGGTPQTTSLLDVHTISPSSIANLFPTVGATGPCVLHVNLGQSGFVFVEANVKKWGLAPASGSLVPPPAYGREQGSILLESGFQSPILQQHHIQQPRPQLKSSQSRARIVAAEVLVQIEEDVNARVLRKHQFINGASSGSGSESTTANTLTLSSKVDGKRSSLLSMIQNASSPPPPPAPQHFSLSNLNVGVEEDNEAAMEHLMPSAQLPEYQEQAESEDEASASIAETISSPEDRVRAVRMHRTAAEQREALDYQ